MTKRLITRNFTPDRDRKILHVVFHTYNGQGRSLYNWFQNNKKNVSAHYAVFLDGQVEQYVEEGDTAHHSGNKGWNLASIGIEHQDNGKPNSPRTDALYEASAKLVAELSKKYDIKVTAGNMPGHNKVPGVSTGCPGALDINRIRRRARELMAAPIDPCIKIKKQLTDCQQAGKDVTAERDKLRQELVVAESNLSLTNTKLTNALARIDLMTPKDFNLFRSIYEAIRHVFRKD